MANVWHTLGIKVLFDDKTKFGFKNVDSMIGNVQKKVQNFRGQIIGLGFSMLFMSLAIRKFASSVFTSLFNTYRMATGEQSAFTQATNEVVAAWEFFKYSIIDALTQTELFWNIIDFLIQMINWLSQLVNRHPQLILIILAILAIGYAASFILAPLGQLVLLSWALSLPFWALLLIIGIIIGVIILLYLVWTSKMSLALKIILTIIIVIGALILILLICGAIGLLPFILIGIAIAVLIILIIKFRNTIKDAFIWIGRIVYEIFLGIEVTILKALQSIIDKAIAVINFLIKIANKIPGIKIPFIQTGTIGFGQTISELEARISASREAREGLFKEEEKKEEDKEQTNLLGKISNFFTGGGMTNSITEGINKSERNLVPSTQT